MLLHLSTWSEIEAFLARSTAIVTPSAPTSSMAEARYPGRRAGFAFKLKNWWDLTGVMGLAGP